ncbi:MAG: DUF4389 domain-containing protein [Shimia sp.]
MSEHRNEDGFELNAAAGPRLSESRWERLFHTVLIAVMLSFASTVLTAATVVQFLIVLVNGGTPNARLADFGTDLGIWIAKAARYQTAASEVKPWPWSDLD